MLIDSHCHILKSEYDNVEEIKKDLFKFNEIAIINNAYSIESIRELVNLNLYSNEYIAIGIGPDEVINYSKKIKDEIESYLNNKKIVAIGEIGLDYYWTKETKALQIKVFRDMLELAEKYNLPVIIHSRDSIQDTYDIVSEYKVKGIMHCFSGSIEMAKKFIDLGFLIGIGGVVTFKNAIKLVEVVKSIDINNISLETDSPYLSPEPYRGKKNVPNNIIEIAKKVANIKGISIDDVINVTTFNVTRMFDLNI